MAREMKDSGIAWVGEIPKEWNISKVGYFFDIQLGKMLQPIRQNASDSLEKYLCAANVGGNRLRLFSLKEMWFSPAEKKALKVEKGDMLVVEGGDVASCDIITEDIEPIYFQNSIHRVRPLGNYDIRILKYWLWLAKGIGHIDLICNKATIAHFSKEKFIALSFIVIPLPDQHRIAAFLDRKCAEIDFIIADTQKSIEEYKALKQSIITEAVTKGVRGERKMKDSGVEWIGDVPEEWEVLPHKYVMHKEKNICEHYTGESILSLTMNGVIVRDLNAGGKMPTTFDGYQYVEPDDMLLCLFDIDVTPRCVGVVHNCGITSPAYSCFKVHKGFYNAYYDYLLRFIDDEKIFVHLAKNLRSSLTESDFGAIKTLAPTYEEQLEIATYLDAKCAEIDRLIAAKQQLLTELESYKKSVIYEYVTGKKECDIAIAQITQAAIVPFYPAAISTKRVRFAQAVLMAKVLDKCHKGMGRVKLEKTMYTIETIIGFDFETEYVRQVAGPLDESLYKCEGIISRVNHWYTVCASQHGVSYKPTKNADKYQSYYCRYFRNYNTEIERIIDIFASYTTEQAEVIATLLAAWNDAIIEGKSFTDTDIVNDVLNNWSEEKKRFSKDVWLRAMDELRKKDLIPKGYGKKTIRRNIK